MTVSSWGKLTSMVSFTASATFNGGDLRFAAARMGLERLRRSHSFIKWAGPLEVRSDDPTKRVCPVPVSFMQCTSRSPGKQSMDPVGVGLRRSHKQICPVLPPEMSKSRSSLQEARVRTPSSWPCRVNRLWVVDTSQT